jgi:galactokinase
LSRLAQKTADAFQQRYGRPATVIAAAPGRVNLIGEHTDYNDGLVLPIAIERATVIAAAPAAAATAARVWCESLGVEVNVSLGPDSHVGQHGAGAYIGGVLGVYAAEGSPAPPLDAVVDSDVPLGAGLSSSAALEVAIALAIEALRGEELDARTRALRCQKAEHIGAGVPCGVMDQFSSAMCREGHALLLDCRTLEPSHVPLADPGVSVLVIDSGVKHSLADGEYAERRRSCEQAAERLGVGSLRDADVAAVESSLDGTLRPRARHVVTEIERVARAADDARHCRWESFGEAMGQSHRSLRDDYQVSCEELDAIVAAAEQIGILGGVYGSRMTGGGFGGSTVTLVRSDSALEVANRIVADIQRRFGHTPEWFVTRPAAGAQRLTLG